MSVLRLLGEGERRRANPDPKLCIVSSCGGHLAEVRALRRIYERYKYFYVVNAEIELPADMKGKTYFIRHSERDCRLLMNIWEAWRILRKERPSLIVSTGAGPAVPFAIVGKLLGVRSIFVETCTQVTTPSLTGRIMYLVADRFFYQWRPLEKFYPKATYGRPVLWSS